MTKRPAPTGAGRSASEREARQSGVVHVPQEIRPVDRSCKSYRPGHQVHWIQAKKSVEEEQPVIYVSVVVHDDGQIDIEGHDLSLVMWNHDPASLEVGVGSPGAGGMEAALSRPECVRLRIQHGRSGRTNGLPAEGRAASSS